MPAPIPRSVTGAGVLGFVAAGALGFAAPHLPAAPSAAPPHKLQNLTFFAPPGPIVWSIPGRACWTILDGVSLYATPGNRSSVSTNLEKGVPMRCGAPGKWTPVSSGQRQGFVDGWGVGFDPPDQMAEVTAAVAKLASGDPSEAARVLAPLARSGQAGSIAWGLLADALLEAWTETTTGDVLTASAIVPCTDQPRFQDAAFDLYVVGPGRDRRVPYPDLFAMRGDRWVGIHLTSGAEWVAVGSFSQVPSLAHCTVELQSGRGSSISEILPGGAADAEVARFVLADRATRGRIISLGD